MAMKQILLTISAILLGLTLRAQSVTYTCRYWFDQNHAQAVTASFSDSTWQADIDVGSLSEGLHNLRLQIADTVNHWNPPQTYLFFKLADTLQEDFVCHYWFDQNHEQIQHNPLGNGHLLLDVADLEDGMHTINVLLKGEKLTTTQNYTFVKVAVENPTDEYQYHCWFDDDLNTMQTGWLSSGCFQLDVDGVSKGFHTINVQLDDNETLSAPQAYMFYRQPIGGYGLARWEYWVNDCVSRKQSTDIVPSLDTLDILALLPVETWPVRSSCFHFHPNGDEPYLNAKNKITFRFWNTDDRFIEQSTYYVDENVSEPIEADTLERNTTVSIAAPRDNQIHWFKLEINRGDYLSFQADKACTMQLFAPSGEEVYSALGPESIQEEGFNVWEDGAYYLAVHDVKGSGETVSIIYHWIYRYTISSYDVHLVGNGGCSTITFQGNGFNSLLDVYLVNAQNDTINSVDIWRESNSKMMVSVNFYQENLGVYDAVFEFFEETIRINGALEVSESIDIQLTSTVSYATSFLNNMTHTFTYSITNNGNMTAYAVPVYVYISSLTLDGISHLELDGLNLASVISDVALDSLSEFEIDNLQVWADGVGEDHHFFKFHAIDDILGDSAWIRSNVFFVNFAPYETKTITLRIVSNETHNVWITVPNETIPPLTLLPDRGFKDWYCCLKDKIGCVINAIDIVLSIFDFGGNPYTAVAGCVFSALGVINTGTSALLCEGGGTTNIWDVVHGLMNVKSLGGMFVSCAKRFIPGKFDEDMFKIFDEFLRFMTIGTLPVPLADCLIAFTKKNPECFAGNPIGGTVYVIWSFDPNDIHGYLSESGSHYMRQEIQNIHYEIEFENDTTLATAAAHTIIVRDTLDASKFDLNSLAAHSVTIGDKRLELSGEQNFARTLDMRPELNVIAQVEQDYDPTTGIVEWTIQSLDPMTMEPTDDPNQGVLPVNYNGDGVGFIDYSVNLREAFADGTEISNRAGIIFDQEDQILTPTWTNIVDAVKPTSHIENVVVENDSLNFSFVSSDSRSGIWYHMLYYRNDSTEMQWQVKKAQIFENSFILAIDSLQTTEYFVIAVDSAGNVETMKMEAEVVVESSASGFPFFVAGYGESANAGWKFIASPIAGSIAATTVDNIFAATQYDLYYFNQSEGLEWRNYKFEPFELVNGQGYLYATKEEQTLVFRGAYNNAETQEVPLVYTEDNPDVTMRGWNLIGNPFTMSAYADRSYYTMNEEGTAIEPNAASSTTAIPACNGVMVKAEAPGETVTFSRATQQNAPNQGCLQIAVKQASTRGNIAQDKAIVSFNAGDQLGKYVFNESNAKLYIPQDGKDLAIATATEKQGEMPLNFKVMRNGAYTININPDGTEFNYLHLIDNLTGADVDLLVEPSYTFEAKTTDYASRFKLVFSVCGNANDDNAPFAFINNGNIIIVGAEAGSVLQVVDMLGRVLVCKDASHAFAISTSGMVKGVYLLRFINGGEVRTLKIVID